MIPESSLVREMVVLNVQVDDAQKPDLLAAVDKRHGRVLADADGHVMVSLAGEPHEIDAIEHELVAFDIVDIQRTGKVALRIVGRDVPLTRA